MQVIFSPQAKEDLDYWMRTNRSITRRIVSLIEAITLNPIEGIGKPERLKYDLSGFWSRRINKEHRLVYEIQTDVIRILSVRGHYM